MKIRASNKLTFAISIFLLAVSQSNMVHAADGDYPPPPPGGWDAVTDSIDKQMEKESAAPQQQGSTQRSAQQRDTPWPQQPGSTQGYGAPRYGAPQYYRQPYSGRRDYDRGRSSTPWGGSSGPSFSGPWDSGRGGSKMPWDSGRGGSKMPWDSGRGGRSMPWDSGRGGRGGFMDKDRFADSWDDMLNAPSDMGELPGGFYAPSVSVPNPVDVGDEFDSAARDVPGQLRNVYEDNRRRNTYDRYDSYDRYDRYDRGGYDRYRR
jgi:hypothetical protein